MHKVPATMSAPSRCSTVPICHELPELSKVENMTTRAADAIHAEHIITIVLLATNETIF